MLLLRILNVDYTSHLGPTISQSTRYIEHFAPIGDHSRTKLGFCLMKCTATCIERGLTPLARGWKEQWEKRKEWVPRATTPIYCPYIHLASTHGCRTHELATGKGERKLGWVDFRQTNGARCGHSQWSKDLSKILASIYKYPSFSIQKAELQAYMWHK